MVEWMWKERSEANDVDDDEACPLVVCELAVGRSLGRPQLKYHEDRRHRLSTTRARAECRASWVTHAKSRFQLFFDSGELHYLIVEPAKQASERVSCRWQLSGPTN